MVLRKSKAKIQQKIKERKSNKNKICTVFTKIYFQQVTERNFSEFGHSLDKFQTHILVFVIGTNWDPVFQK